MPAGAVPVPINAVTGRGKQVSMSSFTKDGRKKIQQERTEDLVQPGKKLFPADRDVTLDVTFPKKMGLSKQRMEECNSLFFYQLLLPIVDPAMSGINGDTKIGYYEEVARNTNLYAFVPKNRGGTRGHVFHPTTAEELFVWDGIVCQNIITNIAESWMMNQSNTFDLEIMEAMHFRRWLDINACLK
jgi:hypothetical protein